MLPIVRVMVKTSPRLRTRCPGRASARLSLPSQSGCWDGSAMSSKIRLGLAAISRLALTTRGTSVSSAMTYRSIGPVENGNRFGGMGVVAVIAEAQPPPQSPHRWHCHSHEPDVGRVHCAHGRRYGVR